MRLNTLQCTGHPSTTKNYLVQNSAKAEKPWSKQGWELMKPLLFPAENNSLMLVILMPVSSCLDKIGSTVKFPFAGSSQGFVKFSSLLKFSFLPLAFLAILSMSLIRIQWTSCAVTLNPQLWFGRYQVVYWSIFDNQLSKRYTYTVHMYIHLLKFYWYKGCVSHNLQIIYNTSYHKFHRASWFS